MPGTTTKRSLVAALLCALLNHPLSAATDPCEPSLDDQFEKLASAADEITAQPIERDIWLCWLSAGDDTSDALMAEAIERRRAYDFQRALEILDDIAAREPGYAEAWNQRAIVKFHLGQFDASLHDIAATLEREPRHFGALAGRGIIRLRQGKPALAYQSILAAMAIHPFIPERALIPEFDFKQPAME